MEKHQLTPAEVEYLKKRGDDPTAIEGAVVHVYSFEDWLDPARDIGPFQRGGAEIWADYLSETQCSTTKEEGVLTVFVLREVEARKIERHKSKIVEGFVTAYTEILNQYFLARWRASKEKNLLVEKELQQLDKLLMQWKEATTYFSYTDDRVLRFQTYGGEKQRTMCDWYERICIDGEDAKAYVSRYDSNLSARELSGGINSLHFVVAALAFHRFKAYLNTKMKENETFSQIEKPIIKANYCCPDTKKIMQNLVERFDVNQTEVRHFESFFFKHPYTNLDLGNVYRDKKTEDLDFEKLLTKIFEVASLFNGEVQDYFFACFDEDAERKNKRRVGETDYHILRKKIEERRSTVSAAPTAPKAKTPPKKDLPAFGDAVKEPEKLPDLWARLSEMDTSFVNESGGFIGRTDGRNAVKVLALAQAISGMMKSGYSQFDTYVMLCTLWGLPPSNRPEKALNQTKYLPTLTDIKDALT